MIDTDRDKFQSSFDKWLDEQIAAEELKAVQCGELLNKEGIRDPLLIPGRLNEIAEEHLAAGSTIARGPLGSVILKLDDGEVHYIPAAGGIECRLYPNTLLKHKGEMER